jgi:hypothetical protein
MNDTVMPEWMKRMRDEVRAAGTRNSAEDQEQQTASFAIKADGPRFWKELKEKIAIAVEFLGEAAKLAGSISGIPGGGIQVKVWRPGISPAQTYTNLAWLPDRGKINCSTLNGGVWNLQFCFSEENGVGVMDERTGDGPLNPEEAAELIMRRTMCEVEAA